MELLKHGTLIIGAVVLIACGAKHNDNKTPSNSGQNRDTAEVTPKADDNPTVNRPENPPADHPTNPTPPTNDREKTPIDTGKETPPAPATPDTSATIQGSYINLKGPTIALAQMTQKPLVIFISAYGCASCSDETQHLLKYLTSNHGGKVPSNVDFVTILLNSSKEDATDWRDQEKIPWEVGYQSDDSLIRKYCAKLITPCTLVRVPYQGIVLAKNGIIPPAQLESLTGGWQ